MNRKSLISTVLIASAVTFAGSAAALASKHNIDFRGDYSARGVCVSIVEDDVNALKAALRSERLGMKSLHSVADTFRCNNMDLDEFAERQDAALIKQFLSRGDSVNNDA